MNKFTAMRIFTRVAEESGFTAAASKLGVSVSAATKAVTRLEDDLGVQLFTRTTRQISITDYGQEYYERCVAILADLEDAEAELRGGISTARGRVRAVLPFSFGRVTVVPELPRFFDLFPQIRLELDFSDAPVDMVARGYDVAVRTGEISDSRLRTRVLTSGDQVTAAAPSYLERWGTPSHPDELAHHNCIVGRFGPEWIFRHEDGERYSVRVSGNCIVNSGDTLREAAVTGLGIIQGTWWLMRRDLACGAVVPLMQAHADAGMPISILYTANRHVPRKVRAFLDFLIEITRDE